MTCTIEFVAQRTIFARPEVMPVIKDMAWIKSQRTEKNYTTNPLRAALAALLLTLTATMASGQRPAKPTPADIHQQIKKLNVLGSVLYVAAHPDDENQRFISYCANHALYDVTYLSLTRGDGGQNLIGPELREQLGVLRSEELLAARSIDGGKQRFSRANDFGYSKNPDETFRIWDRDAVLSDMVWAIRETQPDVIVNRFYHGTKYETHGHHSASAILAVEAFDLSGRTDVYPEQLKMTRTWQPRRILYNLSWWYFGGRDNFDKQDKSQWSVMDLGVYLPLKGKSNGEVAAEARSMHRCQGFGSLGTRGENLEYFDFIKGERPPGGTDIFAGINTTWTRVEGGEKIGKLMADIDRKYRSDDPAASVPDLLKALAMIRALPDGHWKSIKQAETESVIAACLGFYLEATAAEPTATPGDEVKIHLEAIHRTAPKGLAVRLLDVEMQPSRLDTTFANALTVNKLWSADRKIRIPSQAQPTAPYWLQQPFTSGMYTVEEQTLRGTPETPRLARVVWVMDIGGTTIRYATDVAYKTEESAIGEVWRPFEVLPPAYVEFGQTSYQFMEREQNVAVRVQAGSDKVEGIVRLQVPSGWAVSHEPGANAFEFAKKGEEKVIVFTVTAPEGKTEGEFAAIAEVEGRDYAMRLVSIKYDHIPQQSVLLPARVKAARLQLQVTAKNIGYYMGAGDDVPAALSQMGCKVTLLSDQDLTLDKLKSFDAVVLGVRAYNTKNALALHQKDLFDYVKQGGTLVTQYNNNFDYVTDQVAPYKLKIGRARVTDETAEMRFALPDHPVLNSPNELTPTDFEGWVQERGLYFANEWDPAFEAPLSCNDPNEKPNSGSLLVAKHGEGVFIYTSLSLFRELPAGVPGAYRLMANLISQRGGK
jgi:LmbE family N-acetylglucosaminyl deacetylase